MIGVFQAREFLFINCRYMNLEPQQSEDLEALPPRFRRVRRALWNKRELERPTPADALVGYGRRQPT
jgi:hypothetical protein